MKNLIAYSTLLINKRRKGCTVELIYHQILNYYWFTFYWAIADIISLYILLNEESFTCSGHFWFRVSVIKWFAMASGKHFSVLCISLFVLVKNWRDQEEAESILGGSRWTRHDKWAMQWRKHWIRHKYPIPRLFQSLFSIDTQHKVTQNRHFLRLQNISIITYTFCKSTLNWALLSCVALLGMDTFIVTANLVNKDKHGILMALLGQTSEQKKGTGSLCGWLKLRRNGTWILPFPNR